MIFCLFSPEHPSWAVHSCPSLSSQGSGLAFFGEFSRLCKILHVNQLHSGHGVAFALLNSSQKWPTAWTFSKQVGYLGQRLLVPSRLPLSPCSPQTEAAPVATQLSAAFPSPCSAVRTATHPSSGHVGESCVQLLVSALPVAVPSPPSLPTVFLLDGTLPWS